MNSGPRGAWRKGPADWGNFAPIERVRVYYVDGTWIDGWVGARRDGVAGVCCYHAAGRKTWLTGFDEYLMLDEDRTLIGEQLGDVNCAEWETFRAWMVAHG